ncbi:MAG: guanylate kinase [Lachnospiraceae bacterium]|nr:guanylate kinase [Lachnospiraceae bacterium]
MGKLFCLIGKSASGKDTIYRRLLEEDSLGLKPVVTYTTRPKRSGESEGVEYHFTDEKQLEAFRSEGRLLEERIYHTVYGDWHYFTADDGQVVLDKHSYIIITTPEALKGITAYYGRENVVPVYITLDDGERLERALKRERSQEKPGYSEMCRRFLADEKDFSDENLALAGVSENNFFINNELSLCLSQIGEMIRGYGLSED